MTRPRSTALQDDWLEFWEQRQLPIFHVAPYVLLLVATLLDVATRSGFTRSALIDIVLAAVSALWMLWWVTLHPAWVGRPVLMTTFFVGLLGLMAWLVLRSPIYGFYTFTGYFWLFRVSAGRWRLPGVMLVALMSAFSQTGSGPYNSAGAIAALVAVFAINAGVAGVVTWFGWIDNEQKDRRKQMIAELTDTNARLEATLRENAELHGQLLEQARAAGISDERQRLSGEIHDTIAQGLAGIITQLQAAEQANGDSGARTRHLGAAIGLARESLSEARRSVHALRPQPLESARLPDAVRDVAARWSQLNGVPVAVTTTGSARVMRPEIEVALLRTAQEALANVAKHAAASRVGLTLSYMENVVTLDVRDDGIGFLPESEADAVATVHSGAGRGSGYGLATMRRRVEGVSGRLEIESEPYAGTAVSASVPALPALPAGERMSAPIRLMIVDDHPVVRDGLTGMFSGEDDFEVVGDAANGLDAVRRAAGLNPDVILMDLRMPDLDGVSAIRRLAESGSRARVLVLTTYDNDTDVLSAIEAGATGYLLKDALQSELFRAVRAAARGEAVLSPSVATRVMGQFRAPATGPISQRELEVLELVARGATNRDAAAKLFISEATVKTHLMHLYAKLGVSDRAAAVTEAFDRGLLVPRKHGGS